MKLMKHQKEALDFLSDKDHAGLLFEMGLGKTLVMLEHLALMSLQLKKPFPCLIVCPLSVVSVWDSEVKKFGYPFKVVRLVGSKMQRLQALQSQADIYVINYDGLRVIKEALKAKKFQTIILDESHRIKERSSKQTTIALDLGMHAPYRYLLTGTPVTKSPEDVWTQMQWLKPFCLGNFFAFRGRYINFKKMKVRAPGGMREISIPYSFKNLTELENKMAHHCLRRTKKECLDLPPKVYKTIQCEMTEEQKSHYYSLKTSLATMLDDKVVNVNAAVQLLQKLQQICQGFLYRENEEAHVFQESGKMAMLRDTLKDISTEKAIVFAWFKNDIDCLRRVLTEDGHRVIVYDGSADDRAKLVEDFQTSKEPCIFLAQIEKAKEGITLTAASHVLYYGNSWSHASRVQSEDRAHRTGQQKTVVYYDFVIPNTVDEYVLWTLQNKAGVADKITGDSVRFARMVAGKVAA